MATKKNPTNKDVVKVTLPESANMLILNLLEHKVDTLNNILSNSMITVEELIKNQPPTLKP